MSGDAFSMATMGDASLFGSGGEPYLDPGLGRLFTGNPMMGMAAQMLMKPMFDRAGMSAGQFMPHQNLVAQMEARTYYAQQQQAVSAGARLDALYQVQSLNNISQSMFGAKMPAGMESGVQGALGSFVGPMLAYMAPDIAEGLSGPGGSRAVMARNLFAAGYTRRDPVSGLIGWSGDTASMATEVMGSMMFDRYDPITMRGLTAGRVGGLYQELSRRGMMPSGIGGMGGDEQLDALSRPDALSELRQARPEAFAAVAARAGRLRPELAGLGEDAILQKLSEPGSVAREALSGLQADKDPQFDAARRTFDVSRARQKLEEYAGAVSAVRDLFGDIGHPNAPMSQLISGLNLLTQGGLAGMSGNALEHSVRTTWTLAQRAGVGIDALTGGMAQTASLADRMGIPRAFVDQVTRATVGFGAGFADANLGDNTNWYEHGRGQDWHAALYERRVMGAVHSQVAQGLGALFNLESVRGDAGLRGPGASILEAVRAGKPIDFDAFRTVEGTARVLMQSGATSDFAYRAARGGNDAFVAEHELARYVANTAQPVEVQRALATQFQHILGQSMSGARAGRTAADVAGAVMGMDKDTMLATLNDPVGLRKLMAGTLGQHGVGAERSMFLAAELEMAANEWIPRSTYNQYGSLPGMVRQLAPATTRAQQQRLDQAEAEAYTQSALSGVGQTGVLARVVQMTHDGTHGGAWGALGQLMGGVTPELSRAALERYAAGAAGMADTNPAMAGIMERYMNNTARFGAAAGNHAEIERIQGISRGLMEGGKDATRALNSLLQKHHYHSPQAALADPGFSEDAKADIRALLAAGAQNAGGLRGLAGKAGLDMGKVSPEVAAEGAEAARRLGVDELPNRAPSAAALASSASSVLRGLSGSAADIALLGVGGTKLVTNLRDQQLAVQGLARRMGKTVEEALASDDPTAKSLRDQMGATLGEIGRRQKDGAPAMGADERAEANRMAKDAHRPDTDKNREAIDRIVGEFGGGLSGADKDALAAAMTGGDAQRGALEQATRARKAFFDAAAQAGISGKALTGLMDDARNKRLRGMGRDRDHLQDLADEAGDLLNVGAGEGFRGNSADSYQKALKSFEGKPAADKGGGDGTLKVTGLVELKDGQLLFANVRGVESATPAAGLFA